jgi:hypothetical protein
MEYPIIFLIVEGAYILVAAALGLRLTKKGRPYKVLWPTLHIIFAALVVLGMATEVLVGVPHHQIAAQVTLSVSALALLGVVVIGITMLVRKTRTFKLVNAHKWLVIVFAVTLVPGQIFVLLKW